MAVIFKVGSLRGSSVKKKRKREIMYFYYNTICNTMTEFMTTLVMCFCTLSVIKHLKTIYLQI